MARHGEARQGEARRGEAWQGKARRGLAPPYKATQGQYGPPVRQRHHGAADGLEADQRVVVWLHSAAHGKTMQEMK